jgi:type 1 glutamine amidotransferase
MAGMAGETNGSGGSGGASDAGAIRESDSSAPGNDGAAEARADGGGDASGPTVDAAGSNKILIYGVATGYRHTSIPAAANAITKAAAAFGLMAEQVGCTDATNQADPTKFTASALAQYGAVILLANSGEPLGYPATQEIQNLVDYVQRGGALVAIEDASHCYDGTFNGHPASQPFIQLIGGDFIGHPGDVSPATCTTMGTHRSVAQLPMTFTTTDEIYQFSQFRMDNQVVLRCVSTGDSTRTVRPVSWLRDEGAGRYFFTALGHLDASWTRPMDLMAPNSRLVEDHLMPGLLWAMRR